MNTGTVSPRTEWMTNVLRRIKRAAVGQRNFRTSGDYWEERYRFGGNSGAGSYNRLAAFKAEILNDFVATHHLGTVIEFGSGDGAQLQLAEYPDYIGVDVSRTVLASARERFAGRPSIRFAHTSEVTDSCGADLALSLDVIYHLVEDDIFHQYMHRMFDAATKYVIVYSSNTDRSTPDPHVRHRHFSRWVEDNRNDFHLVRTIPNRYPYSRKDPENTSFADFYIFERIVA